MLRIARIRLTSQLKLMQEPIICLFWKQLIQVSKQVIKWQWVIHYH